MGGSDGRWERWRQALPLSQPRVEAAAIVLTIPILLSIAIWNRFPLIFYDTGAYVWQGLQQGQSIETVIANLARDTDADPLSVESDVREFVEELQQKRILPR